ncbi:MAG: hypothetical protein FWD60_05685 [Candidatus Azobacteroides sp.]|nr:hypothetical protein [Candidatus Azobacteroides sp.]
MERTPETKKFIEDHQELFWYSPAPKSEMVSDELLVETILNYGTMGDVQKMFYVIGISRVAAIFRSMTGRKKLNIYPELYNYFNLYFDKYAS